MTVLYVAVAILLIGFLILVHEFGHYYAARLTGVPVHEFAIGFGKRIWSRKKKGIIYSLRLIPFGGFVAFADAESENGIRDYYHTPVWKRLVTTVSGPLMNFIVAFLLAIVYVMSIGVYQTTTVIDGVTSESPAQIAGLQKGDRLIRISGIDVNNDIEIFIGQLNALKGKPADIVVERDGKNIPLIITPVFSKEANKYVIGISVAQSDVQIRLGFGDAIIYSFNYMIQMVNQLLQFLFGLVTQGKGGESVSGVVGITDQIVKSAATYGWQSILSIAVFLSVNLGLFNLLPLPALDGSKVIFLAIEAIRRKPVAPEKEGIITAVGFGLFILLFIFLTGRDIARLFGWVQ